MKVSVCIATYNGAHFLKEQLDSVLLQLSENDEIIISDDSSTDSTIDIIKSYNDPRIKLFPNQQFHSPIFNFENAIMKATGDFIFLCDQDDVWLPNKVNKISEELNNYDLVISDAKVVDAGLFLLQDSLFFDLNSGKGFLKNLTKNTYVGCCMAFRKSVLKYVLPFPKDIAMHDMWIGLCTEMFGKVYFLKEPLIEYRRHGHNVSSTMDKSRNSLYFKLKYRFVMLYELLMRKLSYRLK